AGRTARSAGVAAASPPAPGTVPSTRWTRPASSRRRSAGGSPRRRRRSTTWAACTARCVWRSPDSSARPGTRFDYVGLVNSALRCEAPVVVLEHVDLYGTTGPGPVEDYDYCIP